MSTGKKRIVIGVTGSIGSGKSTVVAMFARLGAKVIDADKLVKEIYKSNTTILKRIVKTFGREALTVNGKLDRYALSKGAFVDKKRARALNEIVHPFVLKMLKEKIKRSRGIIVIDAPLLIESGFHRGVDYVLLLNCPYRLALRRILKNHMLSEAEIHRRFNCQLSFKDKRKYADFLIHNRFSKARLKEQVKEIPTSVKQKQLWLSEKNRGGNHHI